MIPKQWDLKSLSTNEEIQINPKWKFNTLVPRECFLGEELLSLQFSLGSSPRPGWLPARRASRLQSTLGLLCAESTLRLRAPEAAKGALSRLSCKRADTQAALTATNSSVSRSPPQPCWTNHLHTGHSWALLRVRDDSVFLSFFPKGILKFEPNRENAA